MPPAADAAVSPPSTPLRLDLTPLPRSGLSTPPFSVRGQALNDARSNTVRGPIEARFAERLGSDETLREEDLGHGQRRFRRGAACVDMYRTQIAQLNPFDERLRDIRVGKVCE